MKKFIMFAIAAVMTISLASCGEDTMGTIKVKNVKQVNYTEEGILITWDNAKIESWG